MATEDCLKMTFIKELGKGTYGDVYLAENQNGEQFAVKRFISKFDEEDLFVSDAFNESNFTALFNHPLEFRIIYLYR